MFLLSFLFIIVFIISIILIIVQFFNKEIKDLKITKQLLIVMASSFILFIITGNLADTSDEDSKASINKDNKDKKEKKSEKNKRDKHEVKTYTKEELASMSHEELDNIPSDEYLNMSDDISEYYLDRLGQFAPKSDEEEESQDDTEDNTSPDEMTESEYKKNLNAYKTQMEIVGEDLTSLNDSLQSGIITSDTKESTYNAQAMYEGASGLIRTPLEEEEPPEKYKEFNDRLVSMDDRYLEAFELLNESAEANDEASLQVALDTLEVITEEYVVNVKHSLVDWKLSFLFNFRILLTNLEMRETLTTLIVI